MVFEEAEIVASRLNSQEATRAILIQLAAGSIMSKKAGDAFSKTIKKMTKA